MHKYCVESHKAVFQERTKSFAKREIIHLIHKIIKDNVLERKKIRKIEEIKNVLLNRENSYDNDLIKITKI